MIRFHVQKLIADQNMSFQRGHSQLKWRVWIVMRPTENDSIRLTEMVTSQLLLAIASSNLVGRKSKCYSIIKFSLLLSVILFWREISPDTGKTIKNEFVASFL